MRESQQYLYNKEWNRDGVDFLTIDSETGENILLETQLFLVQLSITFLSII